MRQKKEGRTEGRWTGQNGMKRTRTRGGGMELGRVRWRDGGGTRSEKVVRESRITRSRLPSREPERVDR